MVNYLTNLTNSHNIGLIILAYWHIGKVIMQWLITVHYHQLASQIKPVEFVCQ